MNDIILRYGTAALCLSYLVAPMILFGVFLKAYLGDFLIFPMLFWPTAIAPLSLLAVLEYWERRQKRLNGVQ